MSGSSSACWQWGETELRLGRRAGELLGAAKFPFSTQVVLGCISDKVLALCTCFMLLVYPCLTFHKEISYKNNPIFVKTLPIFFNCVFIIHLCSTCQKKLMVGLIVITNKVWDYDHSQGPVFLNRKTKPQTYCIRVGPRNLCFNKPSWWFWSLPMLGNYWSKHTHKLTSLFSWSNNIIIKALWLLPPMCIEHLMLYTYRHLSGQKLYWLSCKTDL